MTSTSGRRVRLTLSLILILTGLLGLIPLGSPAAAQTQSAQTQSAQTPDGGVIPVVQVSGLLDPILANYIVDAIERGNRDGADLIVLQIDSEGSVLDDDALVDVATAIVNSDAPVAAWVGPSGARATGDVAELAGLADRVGVAPGARLGETGEQSLSVATFGEIWGDDAPRLRDRTVNHEQALDLELVSFPAPVVGEFILTMTDLGVTGEAVDQGTQIGQRVRFERLGIVDSQMHTVASPPVAYLLFITGLGLFVFEFFTAGVGVAGIVGAVCFLLGCYGLGVLPTNTWAIVCLVVSMLAFSIDVQTGVPRFWTVVGSLLFIIGSWFLYDGVSMSWLTLLVGILAMLFSMVTGMPTMVRTRFSTPTIGRSWMLGELGEAVGDVAPEGVVKIRDALWRARANRATPITAGGAIRVIAIDGLVLEVEPEDGGARDYRDRG